MSFRKRGFFRWIMLILGLGLVVLVTFVSSRVLFTLADFTDHNEALVFYFKDGSPEYEKRELDAMHYYYELSAKWHLQGLADRYLFKDAPFYEAAYLYMIHDWDKVVSALKDKQDDPRAYLYGAAKFRQAESWYEQGKKKEALELVTKEAADDFELALRKCLESGVDPERNREGSQRASVSYGVEYNECWDRVWNYDLATNKKNAEEALKPKQPDKKPILGPIVPDDNGLPMIPKNGPKPGLGREGKEKPAEGGPHKRP